MSCDENRERKKESRVLVVSVESVRWSRFCNRRDTTKQVTVKTVRVVYVLPAPGFMDDLSKAQQIHVDWNTMVGLREMKRRKKWLH